MKSTFLQILFFRGLLCGAVLTAGCSRSGFFTASDGHSPDAADDAMALVPDAGPVDARQALDASVDHGAAVDHERDDRNAVDRHLDHRTADLAGDDVGGFDLGPQDVGRADLRGGRDGPVGEDMNNLPPVIDDVVVLSPFIVSTELTVVAHDPEGEQVECSFGSRSDERIAVHPEGWTAGCVVVVEENAVPRGTAVEVEVSVRDPDGMATTQTVPLTIGNHPPELVESPSAALLPGEQVEVMAGVFDPDLAGDDGEELHFLWAISESWPLGAVFSNVDSDRVTVTVDRRTYTSGPLPYALFLTVRAADSEGLDVVNEVEVTVLDERGPCVDLDSIYAGTGPARYCGVMEHPCNNFVDAQHNLRGAIDDGVDWPPALRLATAPGTVELHETLVLDQGIGLACGYDPETWLRPEPPVMQRIHFATDVGIRVASPGVWLSGCQLVPISTGTLITDRTGLLSDGFGVVVEHCDFTGNTTLGSAVNAYGARLLWAEGAGESQFIDSRFSGGNATETVVGARVETPLVSTGCRYTGGTIPGFAQEGIGLEVTCVFPACLNMEHAVISSGDTVSAGSANDATALRLLDDLDVTLLNPLIEAGLTQGVRDELRGVELGGSELSIQRGALELNAAAAVVVGFETGPFARGVTLSGVSITVGHLDAIHSTGILHTGGAILLEKSVVVSSDAVGYSTGVETGFDFEAPSVSLGIRESEVRGESSGATRAVGLLHRAGRLTVEGSALVASGAEDENIAALLACTGSVARAGGHVFQESRLFADTSMLGAGLWAIDCADIHLVDTAIEVAAATEEAHGATAEHTDLVLQGVEVTVDGAPIDSTGIHLVDGDLDARDLLVLAGIAQTSVALNLEGDSTRVAVVDAALISDGGNRDSGSRSLGLNSSGTINEIALGLVEIRSGDASSLSEAIFLKGVGIMSVSGCTVHSGSAEGDSIAAFVGSGILSAVMTGNLIEVGLAGDHAVGLQLGGAAEKVRFARNRIMLAGIVGETPGGSSIGLEVTDGCHGCLFDRNRIAVGGGGESSIGMRGLFKAAYLPESCSFITNNIVGSGAAAVSVGMAFSGGAGDLLRVLHNVVDVGGVTEGASTAVLLGETVISQEDLVGVFIGNHLRVGAGTKRLFFVEGCQGGRVARPVRAANTSFWPPIVGGPDEPLAYVSAAEAHDCEAMVLLSTIDEVNATPPYEARTVEGFPSLSTDDVATFADADFHLQLPSPLQNKALETFTELGWKTSALGPLLDIDGEERPQGTFADIGVDEHWP